MITKCFFIIKLRTYNKFLTSKDIENNVIELYSNLIKMKLVREKLVLLNNWLDDIKEIS
jgi:hypothetical protein